MFIQTIGHSINKEGWAINVQTIWLTQHLLSAGSEYIVMFFRKKEILACTTRQ